jgi:hypothetical protein
MTYPLKATKQKLFKKRIFGFDIETHHYNKEFTCGTISGVDRYNNKYEKTFFSKEDVIAEFKNNIIFRNSYVFATNLGFDFWGTFFDTTEAKNFNVSARSGDLLFATTYFNEDNSFTCKPNKNYSSGKKKSSLTFVDTLNYAKISVKKMGSIIGLEKLDYKDFDEFPTDIDKMQELVKYNIRDAMITREFMKFFIETVESLGASFKLTIASTSMSLFKNKYLGARVCYQSNIGLLREEFEAYYGGRTETFKRGLVHDANYYDINSLYPSVMRDEAFPNPNSQRVSHFNSPKYIMFCEGTSKVTLYAPKLPVQILPLRHEGKLVFPHGEFTGAYSHVELRLALQHGYRILKVHKSIYYTKVCKPFTGFVNDMYNKRLEYKSIGSPMEVVIKLVMNGLYGKFGEKFDDKDLFVHQDTVTSKQLDEATAYHPCGDYISLSQNQVPKTHCVPIWALYVTAYARIKMFHYLMANPDKVIYMDTDSLVTTVCLPVSENIGFMKLESRIVKGVFVRPKMYGYVDDKGKETVRVKGMGKKISYADFLKLENEPRIYYTKPAKIKESLKRGFLPNETIDVHKEFSLEDSKRDWNGQAFSFNELQDSNPLFVHIHENLIDNKNPTMSSGANNIGLVAPMMKYENISMSDPSTPSNELS